MVPAWKQVMSEEMDALAFRETWELVSTPTDAIIVGCCWVFTLKYLPDGFMDRYKARLWPKVMLRHMALILLKHSRQLSG